jgi:hypothetical protein
MDREEKITTRQTTGDREDDSPGDMERDVDEELN